MCTHTHPKAMPHGKIKKIFDNIWFVQGAIKMPMWLPMRISQSMTIYKDSEHNALTLINAIRLSDEGLKQIENLGTITNVIRIGGYHGKDDGFFRDTYGAKVYAIDGQTYTRKMENTTPADQGYLQPDIWLTEDSELPIKSASLKILKTSNPIEALLLIDKEGGILVTGDVLQNTPAPDQFVNFLARILMRKMGFYKPYNVGPAWLKFARPEKQDVRSILDLNFEHVLPGHGDPVISSAKEKYRSLIEGELKGAR